MKAVTQTSHPVETIRRLVMVRPNDHGTTTLLIANEHGDSIATYLTDNDRRALIESLGGTA